MDAAFLLTSLIVVASPGTGVLYTVCAGLSRESRASLVAALALRCDDHFMGSRTWNGHEIPDGADLETLARMLDGDPPWLALRALTARRDLEALQLIVGQCGHVDPHKRRAAVEAIGTSPIGGDAIEFVRRALDDPAPPVVDAAIAAIGRLHDEASRPRLRALQSDGNPYYRGYALLALGDMWSDADFEAVIEIARRPRRPKSEERRVRAACPPTRNGEDWSSSGARASCLASADGCAN